jgi:hypothetical protein
VTTIRVVGLLSTLPLVLTALAVEAATIRGQVVSITRAQCHNPRPCEGNVTLWNAGIRKTVRVRSDTRITRAGKPIKFAEVGIGNAVTVTDYGTARSRPRMWGVQSP